MASLITHIYIAKILQNEYDLQDNFILGAILPDIKKSLNTKRKAETHYINPNTGLPDIQKYIDEKFGGRYNQVDVGYLMHLVQDEIWYKKLKEYQRNFKSSGVEFTNYIYSDMNLYDKRILEKMNMEKNKFNELKLKLKNLVQTNELADGIEKELYIRKVENKKAFFVTEKCFKKYLVQATKISKEYLIRLKKVIIFLEI